MRVKRLANDVCGSPEPRCGLTQGRGMDNKGRQGPHLPSAGVELEGQHRHKNTDARPNEHCTCGVGLTEPLTSRSAHVMMRQQPSDHTKLQPWADAQQMCSLEILRSAI